MNIIIFIVLPTLLVISLIVGLIKNPLATLKTVGSLLLGVVKLAFAFAKIIFILAGMIAFFFIRYSSEE